MLVTDGLKNNLDIGPKLLDSREKYGVLFTKIYNMINYINVTSLVNYKNKLNGTYQTVKLNETLLCRKCIENNIFQIFNCSFSSKICSYFNF